MKAGIRAAASGGMMPGFIAVLGMATLLMAQAPVQDHPLRTVKFAAGKTSATYSNSLERGTADTYRFDARMGQSADIRISSIQDNASFSIYLPPATATASADGSGYDIDGARLMGGYKSDPPLDAGAQKRWRGNLPKTGTYYIEISTDRGNADYQLSVEII